ncbi:MAG TPA: SDR family NAD(P)-dependent oxidoreductase [Candidatus Stackebrandtia excrementipullorum]|nr:SDR family NAD(P)-dependent oxidoreductase [Candidatus Stackebrandtia excrementipullorum]
MPMARTLDNSVVVLTGATSGLGAATALRLAARGCRLVLVARDGRKLEHMERLCRRRGATAITAAMDVSDPDAVSRLADRTETLFGHIDAWVSNAAVTEFAKLVDVPVEDLQRVLSVDLLGPVYACREVIPRMVRGRGGVVLLVGSVLGETTVPFKGAYAMAKHGLSAAAATMRQELRAAGHRNTSISVVMPGYIDTPLFGHAANRTGRKPRPLTPRASTARVSRHLVRLLEAPRPRVYLGWEAKAIGWGTRISPTVSERLLGYWGRRQLGSRDKDAQGAGNLYRSAPTPARISGGWTNPWFFRTVRGGRRAG